MPAVGFSNSLVSHAIMVFSAFCMSSTTCAETASDDFRTTGQLHYGQALKQMQAPLPFLGRNNADAVLGCAMVLIPCESALAHGGANVEGSNDWLHHLRGFRTLGAAIYQGEKSTARRLEGGCSQSVSQWKIVDDKAGTTLKGRSYGKYDVDGKLVLAESEY